MILNNYKVTLIVPIYNSEKYINRCLDSVLKQTYNNIEIICVNDCSTDNSAEIVKNYVKKFPEKIIFIENKNNTGPGLCRDRAVELASGDFVMFVDSDDYIKEDYVQTYLEEIVNKKCDVVIGGYTKDIGGKFIKHRVIDSDWTIISYAVGCTKMYRKRFIIDNRICFTDIRYGEDIYFCMTMFYYNITYSIIDYQGYYYFFNKKSTTSTLSYEKNFECVISNMFDSFLKKYDLSKLSERKYRMIEYNYIANMINALITYDHGCGLEKMDVKYNFFIDDLNKKFPNYIENPFLSIFKAKGQTLKIRLAVGVVMFLNKKKLDKFLFKIVSKIK